MRIAIVNDLPLAREALRRLVLSRPGFHIAWVAEDGTAAVRMARQDRPDLILMDLVMPVLDGAEATRQIMQTSPCPILVVTATVEGHFELVLRAMSHGALDAVRTPRLGLHGQMEGGEEFLSRLDRVCQMKRGESRTPAAPPMSPGASGRRFPIVGLGASTGGPAALAQIIGEFPPQFPAAVVVVQHIDVEFAGGLADWLRAHCRLTVEMARPGTPPRVGVVTVAATNDHLVLESDGRFAYTREPADYPFRPSVDVCFHSLAANWSGSGVAAVLTGMWQDGARGLLALRQAGWLTLAQDEATSVVYGMPRAAAELNAACRILPLGQIAAAIQARVVR